MNAEKSLNSNGDNQQPSVGLHIRLAFLLALIGLVYWVADEAWVAAQLSLDSKLIEAEVVSVVDGRLESYKLRLNKPEFKSEVIHVSKHWLLLTSFKVGDKVTVQWVPGKFSTVRFQGFGWNVLIYLPLCAFMFWALNRWGYLDVIRNRYSDKLGDSLKKLFH